MPAMISIWRTTSLVGFGLLVVLGAGIPAPSASQEPEAQPALRIERIEVTPAKAGPESLCQLTVILRNDGDRPASQLAFEVRLEGEPLAVYERQLFYKLLPAGESTMLRLFNFWTSETGRPPPADGALDVEVVLREAQWMEVGKVSEEGGEVETWTPLGAVPALPFAAQHRLPIESGG